VTGGVFLVTLGIIVVTFVALVTQGADIVAQASNGSGSIDQSSGGIAGFLVSAVQTFGIGVISTIASAVSAIAGLGTVLVLGTLLCFYFLADGDRGWTAATSRLTAWRRSEVDAAGGRAVGVLGGYMIGTGAISAFGALTQLAIMVVLGIPLAIPLAVLSFFGGFIPYIGSLLTTGLAFLVTVAVGSPQDVLIMGIYTLVFNIVTGNIVAPLVYGRAVSLHPAIVLLASPAGNEIAGVVGMFLVVPFLGVVATTWHTVLRVFGDPPEVTSDAPDEATEATEPGANDPEAIADASAAIVGASEPASSEG
jgi:predicted PurR-regulated permease PerM